MKRAITLTQALGSPKLFAPFYAGASWGTWRCVLKGCFAEPLTSPELETFREVTARDPPAHRVREATFVIGRSGGKTATAALIAAYIAMSFDPKAARLRSGEFVYVLLLSLDRDQSGILFRYIKSFFEEVPALKAMVKNIGREAIELKNRVIVEVRTNSFRSVRGRSMLAVVFDELSFWRSDESANPDFEMHGAVTPGLARVPNSMLVMISTAHKRSGLLYERFKEYYGKADDDILVAKGSTLQFNSLHDQRVIDKAIASDPALYRSEYFSEWRDDLSTFITRELIETAVDVGVLVRSPVRGVRYLAFADPAHGRGDSFTLCISHVEGDKRVVDLVYERQGPGFNPYEVVQEICKILRTYHVTVVHGDNAAADWVTEPFKKNGIRYEAFEFSKSELYINSLPIFTSGTARLIDNPRIVSQYCGLERRVLPSGNEAVDHGRSGHDDVCNVTSGALLLAAAASKSSWMENLPALIEAARAPSPYARARGHSMGVRVAGHSGGGAYAQKMKCFFAPQRD